VINLFVPHTSPGMGNIFLALLQQGLEIIVPYLVRIFRARLAMGYGPATWRPVAVMFIPKPGRSSYTRPRDFRPISLTMFFLKTVERLTDRRLRDGTLAIRPLHSYWHAYKAGKSVETAIHQLVFRVDKALDQHQSALGVFLDTKGSFNFTSFDSIKNALIICGVSSTIVQWITATIVGHLAIAAISDSPGRLQCPGVAHRKACYHNSSGASSMIWYQGSMEVVCILRLMPMMFICWEWWNSRTWWRSWYRRSFTL